MRDEHTGIRRAIEAGDTPAAAMATLEELEETARLVCSSPVPPAPLGASQIEALRQSFGARW